MNRWTISLLTATALFCIIGCSSGATNPAIPDLFISDNTIAGTASGSQTHLWGYFDVSIDPVTKEIEVFNNRNAVYTANVTTFINANPLALQFDIVNIITDPAYIDVDINVILTHPFPGLPQYNGYDVRGIFMGNGSGALAHNGLHYSQFGPDQFMFADPVDGNGAPDGYTRWYNIEEFSSGGPPLFNYTNGRLATPGFGGTANLNPFRYFADGLGTDDDLFNFLDEQADRNGVFSSGATNDRNYYLRFPADTGVVYGYAVIANWGGDDVHPSNAIETQACEVVDNSTVWYQDGSNNGGDIKLDISLQSWAYQPSTIFIESTVLSNPYEFSPSDMTPVGGNGNFSTYSVEIPADNITGNDNNEFWIMAEYSAFNYSNEFMVPNDAENDPLTAYFRYDLTVGTEPDCPEPVVLGISPDSMLTGWHFGPFTITGTGLVDGPSLGVLLRMDGETDIAGENVQYIDDSTMTAEFDLTDAAEGFWDIVVTNGCGLEATGAGMFEVYSCGTMGGVTGGTYIVTGIPQFRAWLAGIACTRSGPSYVVSSVEDAVQVGAKLATSSHGPLEFTHDVSGTIDRDIVSDSQNIIYYATNADHSILRQISFDSSTGFGTESDFGSISSSWSIWRVTVDDSDNPVILAYNIGNPSLMRVFHWNEDAWDEVDVPSTVVNGNYLNVQDFDFNPIPEHYVFVQRGTGQINMYAVDAAGAIVHTESDVFDLNHTYEWYPGIYIDQADPSCHFIIWGGRPTWDELPNPVVRFDAVYGNKSAGSRPSSWILNPRGPRGAWAPGSNLLITTCTSFNVYNTTVLPPDW